MLIPLPVMRFGARLTSRIGFGAAPDWARVRQRMDASTRFARVPRGVAITADELGGRPVEILTPRDAPADAAVLYLHGGGFTVGSPQMARPYSGAIAAAMGTALYSLDYRLAPEHPYPAAIDDAVAAYRALLDRGIPAGRIAVAGDSAGGTLTLDLALRARDEGLPAPAVLGLICPATDFTSDSRSYRADTSREPLLTAELIAQFTETYLPGMSQEQRRAVSPVYRDITALPPMVLQTAGDDPLAADARRFAELAAKSGAPLRHREFRGVWHVFHAWPIAPAREAIRDLSAALSEGIYGHRTGYRSGQ
ncbi:alpha/beta hydrolase [Nocardia crassostreae]|uniref:alpha/beta hydrolase n=1 Tax=Nocardia crassostreae TaxID=53428 RepID=UPI0014719E99|nr:alpha/beta hydrolase [Nocardia crassostreae]